MNIKGQVRLHVHIYLIFLFEKEIDIMRKSVNTKWFRKVIEEVVLNGGKNKIEDAYWIFDINELEGKYDNLSPAERTVLSDEAKELTEYWKKKI